MKFRSGLSIIEMLVVVALVAILTSFLLGAVKTVRRSAQAATCASNLRQIGIATSLYAQDRRGFLPSARQGKFSNIYWFSLLGPYTDAKEVAGVNSANDFQDAMNNVVKACPNRQKTGGFKWELGYAMNGCVRMPQNNDENSWVPETGIYRDWRLVQVSESGRRAMVGDGGDWHVIFAGGNWYGLSSARHGTTSNYLFYDGHVAALARPQAEHAITNPGNLPGFGYPGWP